MIVIRPYKDGDEEGIRRLFHLCFGKELLPEEWPWKYQQSCLGSSSFLAEADGEIVAHYGGFRLNFCSQGAVLNAFQGCDIMTHPQFRARIFSKKGIIVQTAALPMVFLAWLLTRSKFLQSFRVTRLAVLALLSLSLIVVFRPVTYGIGDAANVLFFIPWLILFAIPESIWYWTCDTTLAGFCISRISPRS